MIDPLEDAKAERYRIVNDLDAIEAQINALITNRYELTKRWCWLDQKIGEAERECVPTGTELVQNGTQKEHRG